ncbi:MAG TPA: type 1 glutamine amidotransferase [Caulobacteraceae bacterium]
MRIGILETGYPPQHLVADHGSYPDMLRRYLGPDAATYEVFDVQTGAPPADPRDYEALFVMGSPAGVYDPLPWIPPLMDYLRSAKGKTALVGVCFGHQVMAQAFGGEVRKSEKGWGLGLHTYDVHHPEPWMGGDVRQIAIPVSHQDQVVERPPSARVVASSAFTPNAVLAYADQPAISFQCHPEFTVDYAKALVERRRGQVPDEALDRASASLDAPNDTPRLSSWIAGFLSGARRQAA